MDTANIRKSKNVLNLTVNGEVWQRVDDLSSAKPEDQVFCGVEQMYVPLQSVSETALTANAPKMGTKLR